MTRTIFVPLLDEGVDVWAPVEAEEERAGVFRLPRSAPPDEVWAFPPGSLVVGEERGADLYATKSAE